MFCLCLTSKGNWAHSLLFLHWFWVRMRQEGALNYASLIHATAHSAGKASACVCACVTVWVWTKCLHRCTDSLEKAGQKQTAWGMVHDGRATVAVRLLARNHILILKNPSNSRKEYTLTSPVQHSFALCLSPRNFAAPIKKVKADFFGNYHFLWRFAETVMVDQQHTESLLVWSSKWHKVPINKMNNNRTAPV